MPTVREFVTDCYSMISSNAPTQPLHGDDLKIGIKALNRELSSYSSSGLLISIAKTVSLTITAGKREVVCGPASYTPTPDITEGRLANLSEAWLIKENTTYPLQILSVPYFENSYKNDTLQSLPTYVIPYYETKVTRVRIYAAPGDTYTLYMRGKFQLSDLTSNDTLDLLPDYMYNYLELAVTKNIARRKSRLAAWTAEPSLEQELRELRTQIENSSEVNLSLTGPNNVMLSGAARLRAGV